MVRDCTGTTKRYYLVSSIKTHLDTLDDVELAVVLAWLKSGGLYRESMLANLEPDKVIAKAEEIDKEAKRIEEAKRAEEEAKRAEESKKNAKRVLWQTPMAAASPKA